MIRTSGKKRKLLKINKGLRHFSMKVCQKVEEKHVTSYNEVADELVREFVTMRPNDSVRRDSFSHSVCLPLVEGRS